jgi:hypothetical protein
MGDALVERMVNSWSFQCSRETMPLLEKLPMLTQTQVARLVQSITENDQIAKAINVPERIRALVSRLS